jgi:hypothetical protein
MLYLTGIFDVLREKRVLQRFGIGRMVELLTDADLGAWLKWRL